MFFFGVFGIENKQKEIRLIQNVVCKACGSMTTYRLIKVYNYFHFFFIPIFKWGEIYYVESRCCASLFEIPREIGRELERGKDIPLNDEYLRQVNTNYGYGNDFGTTIVCHSCGRTIDRSFQFCPHCGNRVK